MTDLSLPQARAIAIFTQGLHLPQTLTTADAVRDRLACVQLDTIAVVRRSHELILLARQVPDNQVRAFLEPTAPPQQFEHWAHAASVVPISLWPYFAFRRRKFREQGWSGPQVDPDACDIVRAAVAEHGTVTITDLGGAKGSGWERSAPAKWAAEWLLATGELVCTSRRRFSRVYSSAHDLPAGVSHDATNDECITRLVQVSLDALGVATCDDIADYFRLPKAVVREHLQTAYGAPTRVQGWKEPAWLSPTIRDVPIINTDACTPLSPFDSLIWHRPRAQRLFNVDYVLEAYKPAAQRRCGYFGMPVLAADQIIGRIALRTSHGVAELEAHELVDGHDPAMLQQAAHSAAAWASATVTRIPLAAGEPHG